MGSLTILLDNSDPLDEVANSIGLAFNIPLIENPTGAYNEYPGYEVKFEGSEGGHIRLLGSPADAYLMEEINSPYSEEEMQYSLVLVFYGDLPCQTQSSMIFSSLAADELCMQIINLLINKKVKIYKKKNPRWVGGGGQYIEYPIA
ncbi:hypothetical protein [Parachitinimonas caeni]|uniref:Uncharacterized protein n=1 Tax=Parachitinimonas caeni TaxID=3031301 RepID=A0ABT7E003_9NEIS|nr:hypothetical protein [Parachitinimonas caeni]MDK2125628.1 hypothetical protein [Parachitinimonas caeni]